MPRQKTQNEINRNIIVTGGASGIGEAVVGKLAHSKTKIIICDREPFPSSEEYLSEFSCASYVCRDVRDTSAMVECMRNLENRLDALVLCAGVGPPANYDPVEIVETDYIAAVRNILDCSHILSEWSSIVLVSSTAAYRKNWDAKWDRLFNEPFTHGKQKDKDLWIEIKNLSASQAYCLAKWGILLATKRIASIFANRKVRVNCVIPGPTKTAMSRQYWQNDLDSWNRIVSESPFNDHNSPAEVASIITFLMEPQARMVDASLIHIDGGWYAFNV